MALPSAAHRLISTSPALRQRLAFGVAWSAFLTLLVAGPWLWRGYLFGTDWPGPRHVFMPTELSSSAPLQAILALGSDLLGGEIVGKVFVLAILFGAGILAYLAIPTKSLVARAAGAALYVLNPFVHGRLHYGQLFLLGAYALLPLVAMRVRELANRPGKVPAVLASVALVLVGVFSPHVWLMAGFFTAIVFLVGLFGARPLLPYLRDSGRWFVASGVLTAVASAYWIIPLLGGRGYEGGVVASTSQADIGAYAAIPDANLGLVPNLLGLYGFWAESTGRFTSMKSFVPIWPVVLTGLLVVCFIGVISALRRPSDKRALWALALLIAGAVALILEMGYSQPLTRGLVNWLDATFIPYRGMRDAGKWAALLALVYSQLFGVGVEATLSWIRGWRLPPARVEWAGSVAAGLLLAVPLYYGNGLLFGAHGEIKPSPYPPGWYTADRVLAGDTHPGKTLFLPWHEYMSYSFVLNENRVIVSPASTFFSVPIVSSANPEIGGVAPPSDPEQRAIAKLVSSGGVGQWANVLADHGIKYVLLAKELDWSAYAYLDDQPGLSRVGDFGSIVLYRDSLAQ